MGILKRAGDLVYTIRFLKLLVTPFEETEAYKLGIIDKQGNKNPNFSTSSSDDRQNYKDYYTPFHRLVFNIKKLLPGRSIASYAAALYLIKEHGNVSEKNLLKIIKESKIKLSDLLKEESKWYVIDNDKLSPGVYHILNDTLTTDYLDIIKKDDKIRIEEKYSSPVGDISGINIYRGKHLLSNKYVYVSTGNIRK